MIYNDVITVKTDKTLQDTKIKQCKLQMLDCLGYFKDEAFSYMATKVSRLVANAS